MSCSSGSRIWKELKREVGCAIDDILSLSRDFKYGVLKVKPYVSESEATDCETSDETVPEGVMFGPHASADALPLANGDLSPFMVTWSTEEDSVLSEAMPAEGLNYPPEEVAEEITILSSGAEPARTTSVPIGYESPYIRALMAETSLAASRSDGYVFDFDHIWDEEDDEVPKTFAEPEPAVCDPVNSDISEPAEAQEPNFVIFDLTEAAEEKAPVPDLVMFDLPEPAEAQEPNFVIFDLTEAAEEEIPIPNFILVYPEGSPKEILDETKDLMEMTIPGLVSDAEETEDAYSDEPFLDDDANLAPMLIEECQVDRASEQNPVPAVPAEQSLSEGAEICFGFLSGAFGNPGESGIDFMFGKDEDDSSHPEHTYEVQTEQSIVRASPVQTQKMYL